MIIADNIRGIIKELPPGVSLVAVSKFHSDSAIMEAYNAGQRVFGENRPQEFALKAQRLPKDIVWHFIGHLQTNKLKLVLPYASMVESIDSVHLMKAVEKWAAGNEAVVSVLLELHLGAEETKHGLNEVEIRGIIEAACKSAFPHIRFCGLMGMATNTGDENVIRADFARISTLFQAIRDDYPSHTDFTELSIGMSADWRLALEFGATIVRIGSRIFGEREYRNAP